MLADGKNNDARYDRMEHTMSDMARAVAATSTNSNRLEEAMTLMAQGVNTSTNNSNARLDRMENAVSSMVAALNNFTDKVAEKK